MAWLVCILESPTSNTVGIKWWEYVKGLVDRKHFRKRYLQPMLKNGWLKMTIPAAPRSSLQRYVADVHDLTGGSAE